MTFTKTVAEKFPAGSWVKTRAGRIGQVVLTFEPVWWKPLGGVDIEVKPGHLETECAEDCIPCDPPRQPLVAYADEERAQQARRDAALARCFGVESQDESPKSDVRIPPSGLVREVVKARSEQIKAGAERRDESPGVVPGPPADPDVEEYVRDKFPRTIPTAMSKEGGAGLPSSESEWHPRLEGFKRGDVVLVEVSGSLVRGEVLGCDKSNWRRYRVRSDVDGGVYRPLADDMRHVEGPTRLTPKQRKQRLVDLIDERIADLGAVPQQRAETTRPPHCHGQCINAPEGGPVYWREFSTLCGGCRERATEDREAREQRLADLGFEPVSQDQRRAFLALNVALKDWPE